ncbi:carboxymuconolactone decarboxylase family protein [Paenibacillus sp. 1001270B_150601_E10]|uniref:carboxymuconolactone decarboxylase family protein n=1 Tax=Paenibacillus sp. 1001270B_150601_E10 TaxID=2787079 RepID=UPI00189C68E3|nr:carboxymuconolactone decarboxylase family protein [Paenibacillus sp. 1001270B_150601_E10]
MNLRINWRSANTSAFHAMLALDKHVNPTVDDVLHELIKIRASQMNGCAFCIDMHTTDLMKMGDHTMRIMHLSVWRESPLFTAKEKAVLELTEYVTKIADSGVPDDVYERVREHFNEKEYVDLVMAILTINGWNRIALATGMYPGCFDK